MQQYHQAGEVDLYPTPGSLLTTPVARPARQDWEVRMHSALAAGQAMEGELLEEFTDADFEESEWQW